MKRNRWLSVVLVTACLAAAAASSFSCGSGDGGSPFAGGADASAEAGPLDGLTSLALTPGEATIAAGDAPTTATFTAQGTFADGTTRDVTSLVTWSAGPIALLSIAGGVVSPAGDVGGDGTVIASGGDVTTNAKVRVVLKKSVVAPGAPADAAAQFAGAAPDPAFAPAIAYPLDGVLVPPNLAPLDVQWSAPAGATLFDLHFTAPTIDLHVYTPCTPVGAPDKCSFTASQAVWTSIVSTLEGEDPVSLVVRAAGGSPKKIGESAPIAMQFASSPVQGGLYYFNTRGTTMDGGVAKAGIYRFDFESGKAGPFFTDQQCAGCHALSKDGTKMLAPICTDARGCGRPLQLAVIDVATQQVVTPPMPVGDSDTQAWSPDNKFYVTTPSCAGYSLTAPFGCTAYSGGVMTLVDATTNTALGNVPAGAGALFPSFSNDGARLAYARGATYNAPLSINGSSIYTIDFKPGSTPPWGAEKALVPSSGENNYYPSYSPDDAWVVFARSQCDAGDPSTACDSYDDPSARVFVVPAAGGAPIELSRANGTPASGPAPKLDDSWPKWSPFKGQYKGGDIFWLTFSSVRDYGFRTPADAQGGHVRQLWLVGFDLARAKAGKDPSFAPLWLPFQETTTSNHIGQWTEKAVGVH